MLVGRRYWSADKSFSSQWRASTPEFQFQAQGRIFACQDLNWNRETATIKLMGVQ
jgi:hypothetical protein